jgi:hypothetical protein
MTLESQIPPEKQYAADIMALKLQYASPSNAKIIILVEGADDARIYRLFFDAQHTFIKEMKGKVFVEKALNDLNTIITNIIGIRDADFLHLENTPSPLPNLFLTDTHDLELMLLQADSVFQKLVNEYNINANFRAQLLEIVAFLGYFRWYNEKNDWYNEQGEPIGFTFTGLQLNKFYKNNALDKQNLVEQVIKQSKQVPETDSNQTIYAVAQLQNNTHDLWQVCNGHDCIKVLAAHINQVNFGKKSINDKDLEQSIRFAYHITDFKQSILYKNTQAWASTNNCVLYKS